MEKILFTLGAIICHHSSFIANTKFLRPVTPAIYNCGRPRQIWTGRLSVRCAPVPLSNFSNFLVDSKEIHKEIEFLPSK